MPKSKKSKVRLPFPLKGINRNFAAVNQPPLTSPELLNVRPYDVVNGRMRGGQRPGLKKAYSACIGNGKPVVAITEVTIVEAS